MLADEFVVVGVSTDPEPEQSIGRLDGDGPVMEPDTRGPEPTDLLEVKRWVSGVGSEKGERLISELPNLSGKRSVAGPEVGRGVVLQSLVD